MVEFRFVKMRNRPATRISYPYDDTPYLIPPSRTCRSVNGSIILCSSDMRRIQRSGFTDIHSSWADGTSCAAVANLFQKDIQCSLPVMSLTTCGAHSSFCAPNP